jgi:hypothetical protein
MYIPDSKYKHWGDVADLGDKFVYFNPYSKRYEVFRFSSVSTHLYQAFPINGGDNSDWKFLEALGSNISNNLLKNNNAQKGLKYWDIIQNGGEGFASGFYNNSVNKGFNTSYSWNIKEQTIDMSKFGILTDKDTFWGSSLRASQSMTIRKITLSFYFFLKIKCLYCISCT